MAWAQWLELWIPTSVVDAIFLSAFCFWVMLGHGEKVRRWELRRVPLNGELFLVLLLALFETPATMPATISSAFCTLLTSVLDRSGSSAILKLGPSAEVLLLLWVVSVVCQRQQIPPKSSSLSLDCARRQRSFSVANSLLHNSCKDRYTSMEWDSVPQETVCDYGYLTQDDHDCFSCSCDSVTSRRTAYSFWPCFHISQCLSGQYLRISCEKRSRSPLPPGQIISARCMQPGC